MEPLAVAVVAVPFLGAIACLVGGDRASKSIGVVAALLTFAAVVGLTLARHAGPYLFGAMPWLGEAGAKGLFGYQLDPLAFIMLSATTLIGVAIAVYSAGYLSGGNRDHPTTSGQARYYFWLLLFVGSMVGIAIAPTLLQLLFFWEMTTLCSWALISFYDDPQSIKAGMKALMMTSFGGLFFLCGLVWVVSATGSLAFSALGRMAPGVRAGAFALFLIAAWAKSAQLPFHTWLPDAMAAPTPISAYLHAAAMVKAGVFLIARLLSAGWSLPTGTGLLVSVAALLTMFAALYLFFFQDDLKRLLAYSTIAQLAYIFFGLGLGSLGVSIALRGSILHIFMHALAKTTLFLAVGAVAYAAGTRSISQLSGLASKMPIAATSFFVGAFALTGVPPLGCFWSKLYLLMGALQTPGIFGPLALILLLVESLVSFGWFLWVGQRVFWGKEKNGLASEREFGHGVLRRHSLEAGGVLDPSPGMNWVLIGMIVLTLLSPLLGIPLVWRLALP